MGSGPLYKYLPLAHVHTPFLFHIIAYLFLCPMIKNRHFLPPVPRTFLIKLARITNPTAHPYENENPNIDKPLPPKPCGTHAHPPSQGFGRFTSMDRLLRFE